MHQRTRTNEHAGGNVCVSVALYRQERDIRFLRSNSLTDNVPPPSNVDKLRKVRGAEDALCPLISVRYNYALSSIISSSNYKFRARGG